jgi:hypothetical protein
MQLMISINGQDIISGSPLLSIVARTLLDIEVIVAIVVVVFHLPSLALVQGPIVSLACLVRLRRLARLACLSSALAHLVHLSSDMACLAWLSSDLARLVRLSKALSQNIIAVSDCEWASVGEGPLISLIDRMPESAMHVTWC